jgi:hypothetical protein
VVRAKVQSFNAELTGVIPGHNFVYNALSMGHESIAFGKLQIFQSLYARAKQYSSAGSQVIDVKALKFM